MDENEFRRVLDLFPLARSRDYHADLDFSRQSSRSGPSNEWQDAWSSEDRKEAFWGKLKSAAERKVGPADAERFCQAFQQVYKKLVYEELTLDAAKRILKSRNS